MTVKRFIEFATQSTDNGEINNGFQDIKTGEWYYTKNSENAKKICDVLNELYEEVMDLRRENTKFKLTVSVIIEDMQKYVDDNQLIYINQSYVDWIKKEVDTTLYSQKKELEE